MGNNETVAADIKPLPKTVHEMMGMRKNKTMKVLHDEVESIHKLLIETDEEYWKMLDAVYPAQAIEGSLIADDFLAVTKIRKKAEETSNAYVAEQKLETLRRSLHVVLRRYGLGRKERREWKNEEVAK